MTSVLEKDAKSYEIVPNPKSRSCTWWHYKSLDMWLIDNTLCFPSTELILRWICSNLWILYMDFHLTQLKTFQWYLKKKINKIQRFRTANLDFKMAVICTILKRYPLNCLTSKICLHIKIMFYDIYKLRYQEIYILSTLRYPNVYCISCLAQGYILVSRLICIAEVPKT